MFYQLIRPFAILATQLFFKKIRITRKALLRHKGPLLLAVNHPNSFLDAILLCTLFNRPVYSLTRGDAFKKKSIARILYALKMLPVYREREGAGYLQHNYATFNTCLDIFQNNGIVLIFSEALCINEWHLRPIKKGTARLAALAWQKNIPLKILPIGLNYSSFDQLAKTVHVNLGTIIAQKDILNPMEQNGKYLGEITSAIQQQLSQLVYEIDQSDKPTKDNFFKKPIPVLKKLLLFFPALFGILLHSPIYYPLILIIRKKAKNTGHYDSIILALFFLSYPVFILMVCWLLYFFTKNQLVFTAAIFLPFCAWSYAQIKDN